MIQWADNLDAMVPLAYHIGGHLSGGDHLIGFIVEGNHGRLVGDDSFPFDIDQYIGGTQIDTDILAKRTCLFLAFFSNCDSHDATLLELKRIHEIITTILEKVFGTFGNTCEGIVDNLHRNLDSFLDILFDTPDEGATTGQQDPVLIDIGR